MNYAKQLSVWLEEILLQQQDKGAVTTEEHRAFAYSIYSRTADELRAPFESKLLDAKDGDRKICGTSCCSLLYVVIAQFVQAPCS